MSPIPGWCKEEKALLMMDLIKENQCTNCLEIGVFAGKSLFPIARTLQYNQAGKVYGIDAWDPIEATKGYNVSDPHYIWWIALDFDPFFLKATQLIEEFSLADYVELIKSTTEDAASLFVDESIDFLHLDGNHSNLVSYQDVTTYFPKVKDGGYIILNDSHWISMMRVLVFLLERTELVSPFSRSEKFIVFRKTEERVNQANLLLKDPNVF
jgi:predicted O-methyltransferase YrrM